MPGRKRRKRKTIDELDEFVVGEDFVQGLEDINHEGICEPKVGKKKKGRSMSAEEAQLESAAEKQCVDCGVVLAYATKKDKQRFRDHMVVHEAFIHMALVLTIASPHLVYQLNLPPTRLRHKSGSCAGMKLGR